ncbi:MAG: trigger factor [Acidobacteriota bacterium]
MTKEVQKETKKKSAKNNSNKKKENIEKKIPKKTDNKPSVKETIKKISLIIPRKDIDKKFEETVDHYSSEIKMPGFRKGKVPVDVIKKKYKEVINDEVVNKLIEEYTFKEIKEKNIKIASNPVIESFEFKDGKDLKAEVKLELLPEVIIPEIKGLEVKVEKEKIKVDEFNEKKQIDAILESNKRKKPANEREIKDGDFIEFKIQSQFADTKRMMPKNSSQFEVKKDNEYEINDLYKEIIGKKKGDKLNFTRTYSKDSIKKSWSGKKINHLIEISEVYEFSKPEFDEEFIKSIGFENEKKFKEKMKEEYLKQTEKNKDEIIIAEIRDKLIELCEFNVPGAFVEQELQRTTGQYGQILMSLPEDKRNEYLNSMRANAEQSIKFSFIIEEIKKKYEIKVLNEDMEKEYKIIAEANNVDIKEVRKYYLKKENKESLTENMERNKALEFLKNNISIKEV